MEQELHIIYQDEHIVAINKPHGLLVHRTSIANDVNVFALQLLRDQIGKYLYPIHRIDRKTSGVLVFALSKESAKALKADFTDRKIHKKYYAIVRGYFADDLILEYDLTNDRGKKQSAITHFKCLETTEIPISSGKYSSSRYSLVEAIPKTGRMHQLRKHLKHLKHPIIGDRPHGCNIQNRFFKAQWQMIKMLLHAQQLHLKHPISRENIIIEAPFSTEFLRMKKILGFSHSLMSI